VIAAFLSGQPVMGAFLAFACVSLLLFNKLCAWTHRSAPASEPEVVAAVSP
jgi:hypothetical protein